MGSFFCSSRCLLIEMALLWTAVGPMYLFEDCSGPNVSVDCSWPNVSVCRLQLAQCICLRTAVGPMHLFVDCSGCKVSVCADSSEMKRLLFVIFGAAW